ncbi:MAG: class I SAM-dependent methyltransferase [Burkholderiaceae bacterium]|nr:class I SAM-dependent methyltransferase [Burkholderiaceae bacterium]
MNWTEGYASDIEYTAGFYAEQSPSLLNFVCALNGYEPVPLQEGFDYCELGFGRGLTANVLAAANPQGRFYAADFNPAHVGAARDMANKARLGNLTLLEASFEALAQGEVPDLPQFDFITLHGIYTWVTAANQAHIVRFIERYLKPGGIVYVSYNAMPGWAGVLPLQRLLVDYAEGHPERSDTQLRAAGQLVRKMDTLKAGYFSANGGLAARIEMLEKGNPHYLVHEYMHKHWQPLYHADVARDLAAAKLDYAGNAELPLNYPRLYLDEERFAVVESMKTPALRETMKDYFRNTGFRKDVFIRGARRMSPLRQAECLGEVTLYLTRPRNEVQLKLQLPFGEINALPDLYNPVLDALAQRPCTLAELRTLPNLASQPGGSIAQIAVMLVATRQAALTWAGAQQADHAAALRLNQVLANLARFSDEYQILCTPALASGITATHIDLLVYHALQTGAAPGDTDKVVQLVWRAMRDQGRLMRNGEVVVQSDADNLAALAPLVAQTLTQRVPLWRQLRAL